MKEHSGQNHLIDLILSDSHLGPLSFKEIHLSADNASSPNKGRKSKLVADITLTFGEGEGQIGFTRYWFAYNKNGIAVTIMVKYHSVNDNPYDLAILDGQIRWHSTRELVIKRTQVMVEFKANLIKILQARQITR